MFVRLLEFIGASVLELLYFVGDVTLLFIEAIKQLPVKIRFRHVLNQMSHLGVDTLPIVSLTMTFTGMVMTLQIAHEFIKMGAESTVGGILAIAIGRELGPVLVGVVAAGRVGSAMTAEISTMKVTEQIDALRVMGTNPTGYLVVPRMLACMMMVPILTVYGDMIGVLGGWLVAKYYSGISTYVFINSISTYTDLNDMTGGLIKAVVFGGVIAILGCYYGMKAPEGAEGVGKATTKSVVSAIVVIFMVNVLLSMIIY
ncbi:MAG: ABC transporter permease [Anaerovibrio sp.]|uniref:MlaE family ABC transporter permease n=1 Tax=Anaerovibrio sp. TaxID=1872532 RepID=UPI0025B97032|nr:ABC transporter permease [Anaerovibrio sp.]MBE6099208.1 ABC transporter permease [Anaerovibrio sp.]MBQ3853737.1 ABC transporter permease [Anaerovibrio sp.]